MNSALHQSPQEPASFASSRILPRKEHLPLPILEAHEPATLLDAPERVGLGDADGVVEPARLPGSHDLCGAVGRVVEGDGGVGFDDEVEGHLSGHGSSCCLRYDRLTLEHYLREVTDLPVPDDGLDPAGLGRPLDEAAPVGRQNQEPLGIGSDQDLARALESVLVAGIHVDEPAGGSRVLRNWIGLDPGEVNRQWSEVVGTIQDSMLLKTLRDGPQILEGVDVDSVKDPLVRRAD